MIYPTFSTPIVQLVNAWNKYTAELQWLEHLLNHEKMFETGVVRANECQSQRQDRRHNGYIFLIFSHMMVYCVFSLESPHRGDSNEYTQHIIINIKSKSSEIIPKYNNVRIYGIFC